MEKQSVIVMQAYTRNAVENDEYWDIEDDSLQINCIDAIVKLNINRNVKATFESLGDLPWIIILKEPTLVNTLDMMFIQEYLNHRAQNHWQKYSIEYNKEMVKYHKKEIANQSGYINTQQSKYLREQCEKEIQYHRDALNGHEERIKAIMSLI